MNWSVVNMHEQVSLLPFNFGFAYSFRVDGTGTVAESCTRGAVDSRERERGREGKGLELT